MGYYIETPQNRGKAEFLIGTHGARKVSGIDAKAAFQRGKGVVCVIDNVAWEAAAFIYSDREFDEFDPTNPRNTDYRPRTWLVMDLAKAKELSGYRG